jgi:hypothetical protein
MAFTIASSSTLPFIHARMLNIVRKNDLNCVKSQLMELVSQRRPHSYLYLGINLSSAIEQDDVPLVRIITQFAEAYHELRQCYQLEILVVIDPSLMPGIRYVADSLGLPILFFASYEAMYTYVSRRNSDTQTAVPKDRDARVKATLQLKTQTK